MERIIAHYARTLSERTKSEISDISLNFDNQPVSLPQKGRGNRKVKRTVYRVDIDDAGEKEIIVGSVLVKGEWQRVVFDEATRTWRIRNA